MNIKENIGIINTEPLGGSLARETLIRFSLGGTTHGTWRQRLHLGLSKAVMGSKTGALRVRMARIHDCL